MSDIVNTRYARDTDKTREQLIQELRESEARFRLLFEKAPLSYQSLDKTGCFIEVNQAWLNTMGYTREEIIGKSFADFLHPDWRDHFRVNFPRFKAVGEVLGVEFEMVKKDGSPILVSFNGKIGKDEKGSFSQTHCILHDITETKKADEALRQSEKRYKELVQNANSAIIRWKCDGSLTFFNEYAQSLFGYSTEEVLGKDVSILVPQKESTGTDLTMLAQDIVEHPENYVHNINENMCKDGRRLWMVWTNKPITDAKGRVNEILAIGTDITNQKMTEQKLRESESFYRAIARNFPDGAIYVFDRDLRFRIADGQALQALGFTRENFEGRTIWESTDAETCKILEQRYPRVLAGESLHFETQLKGRIFSSDYVPIRDDHGNVFAGTDVFSRCIRIHQ